MKSFENVLLELKKQGQKLTKYRMAVLSFFYNSDHPLSVQEILETLSTQGLEPNKTTVYREISALVEQGILTELDLGDNRKRYELAHLGHHHHLICTQCNSIEDIVLDEDLTSLERKVRAQSKFHITNHVLEFYGLCSRCQ